MSRDLSMVPRGAFVVTPSTTPLIRNGARSLFIGTGGDVQVTTYEGDTVTFSNVPDGFELIGQVTHVLAAGTTASDIIART